MWGCGTMLLVLPLLIGVGIITNIVKHNTFFGGMGG